MTSNYEVNVTSSGRATRNVASAHHVAITPPHTGQTVQIEHNE